MPVRAVTIPTSDGSCDASIHTPNGEGPWPAVIMYTDAGGVRPTFHEMAQRLADLGYAVLLPNPYYRLARSHRSTSHTVFTDADERARLMSLVASVTKELATRDAGAQSGVPGGAARGARHRASARPATAWAAACR